MAGKQSKIEILLNAKDTGLAAAFARAKTQVSSFGSAVSAASSPVQSLISSAFSLKTALGGIVAGAGVTALGASLLQAGQRMDGLRLSFLAIAGSTEAAGKEMEFVRTTADKLGLDLETAAKAYKSLAAAAMGSSLSGKQVRDIFIAVSKASTTLGLSADETSGALLAISQMISKGKVSAEELRGQLGERLPGAFQVAAQAMGMTTAEFDKAMASGNIMADEFIPKFAVALEQRFGKSADSAANTFTSAGNRISSSLFTLKAGLGEAVTNNTFFVTVMNDAGAALKNLSTDVEGNGAKWREWAKQSALAVIDTAAATITGFNSIYKGFSAVNGAVNESIAYVYRLKEAWLEGAVAGQKFKDGFKGKLGIESDGTLEKLTTEYEAAKKKAEEFSQSADKNWKSMEEGSSALATAARSVQEYRDKMAQVASTEVIGTQEKKAAEEIVKIGDKYVNVTKQIKQSNQETTEQVGIDWGAVWQGMEKESVSAAKRIDEALTEATRPRTVEITYRETGWPPSYSEGYKSGGLIQALASGGSVRNILAGGFLPGFGGGDRRLLLGEDGEVMLNKQAVRAAGLKAALAFNAGRWDVVMAELSQRVNARIGYHLGGLVQSLPMPQQLATGGAVGGGAGADFGTINLSFPGGATIPVTTTRESARALVREFTRMQQRSSR